MAEIHIDVGIAALSRGFITHDVFLKAVAALARSNGQSVHELWVGQGHMTETQLTQLLSGLGKASETVVMQAPKRPVISGPATEPTAASIVPDANRT
jgi:hypothetical protein